MQADVRQLQIPFPGTEAAGQAAAMEARQQESVARVARSAAECVRRWFSAKSETFTRLCGEEFTRGEVVAVNAGVLVTLALTGVITYIAEGGAL